MNPSRPNPNVDTNGIDVRRAVRYLKIKVWCARSRHRGCSTCLWDVRDDHDL